MRKTKSEILEGVNLEEIKKSKLVDTNTLEIEYQNGDRAIRLHNTNIITIKENGDVILTSGGWRTLTTKDRINKYIPLNLHLRQDNFNWLLKNSHREVVFFDNITFDNTGKVKNAE